MKVILYSTHCPKCNVLIHKLKEANIEYEEITDTDTMINKGFTTVPVLEVDGKTMDFLNATQWIKERNK